MKTTSIQLYRYLAMLFYSVAECDHTIWATEFEKMSEAIIKFWPPQKEAADVFAPDAACQIQREFETLVASEWEAETAWTEFKKFYVQHQSMFTEQMKGQVLQTAYFIALAVAGVNKSELYRLTMLQLLFA